MRDFLDLTVPVEPTEIKDRARAYLEDAPEKGAKTVNDAAFIADYLWEQWGDEFEAAEVRYDRFLAIARGNAGEARLWVVGERPWEHFADGLAGRVRRRAARTSFDMENTENELAAATGVCG